jgi:CRISPR system Cascade subunit CasE
VFLSYLLIDTAADPARLRPGRSWVRQPYRVHQRLCMAFPDGRRRVEDPHFLAPFNPSDFAQHVHTPRKADAGFLFRIDPLSGVVPSRHGISVQSAIKPDWDYAFHNAPEFLAAKPMVNPFNPSFAPDERLRFRLRANPTKKVASLSKADRLTGARERDGNTKNGRRLALLREDEQVAWLLHKGEQGGFRIPGEWVAADNDHRAPNFRVDVIPEGWVRCGKDGHADGRFYAVRFEGVLEVTDPDQFLRTVVDGIGSAKGFGFGLLSLAPERG